MSRQRRSLRNRAARRRSRRSLLFSLHKGFSLLLKSGCWEKQETTDSFISLPLVENKANIVTRVLEKEDVTITDSVGVGDTEGDTALLESVQIPICFNPNSGLFEQAKRRDWKVVVERKDVIYEL